MKQPEALRLKDALLDAQPEELLETELVPQAAAELERLYTALKRIADQTYDPWTNGAEAQRIAIAAIAKGEQQ